MLKNLENLFFTGVSTDITVNDKTVRVSMLNNPSHLEVFIYFLRFLIHQKYKIYVTIVVETFYFSFKINMFHYRFYIQSSQYFK